MAGWVKRRTVGEVMEIVGSQIRLNREEILRKQQKDQFRRLFRYSAEEMIVAWTGRVTARW